jgi:hypothetical protein
MSGRRGRFYHRGKAIKPRSCPKRAAGAVGRGADERSRPSPILFHNVELSVGEVAERIQEASGLGQNFGGL